MFLINKTEFNLEKQTLGRVLTLVSSLTLAFMALGSGKSAFAQSQPHPLGEFDGQYILKAESQDPNCKGDTFAKQITVKTTTDTSKSATGTQMQRLTIRPLSSARLGLVISKDVNLARLEINKTYKPLSTLDEKAITIIEKLNDDRWRLSQTIEFTEESGSKKNTFGTQDSYEFHPSSFVSTNSKANYELHYTWTSRNPGETEPFIVRCEYRRK